MEYTKKHKNLIAKFFKKVGMPEEASTVLSDNEYNYEIAVAMRDASTRMNMPLSTPALLDAIRRYETQHCLIFVSKKYLDILSQKIGTFCDNMLLQ